MLLLYRFFRMHGRVKVKSDSQKAEEKKQRRLEQLEQFKFARTKIDQLFSSIQKVNIIHYVSLYCESYFCLNDKSRMKISRMRKNF